MVAGMRTVYPCPCCVNYEFSQEGSYEICPVCNWEDDPVQYEDPNFGGGANFMSLNEAKEAWSKGLKVFWVFILMDAKLTEKKPANYLIGGSDRIRPSPWTVSQALRRAPAQILLYTLTSSFSGRPLRVRTFSVSTRRNGCAPSRSKDFGVSR